MKRITRAAVIAAAVLFTLPSAGLFAAQPDFESIVRELDKIDDFSGMDFSGVFTIVSEKPGEKQSVTQIRMFRRDSKKQFLILIQLPEASKGQGYLKEDDNVWMYDPTSRKFTHSSVKENLQDSEAKNSDFTRESILDDYAIEKGEAGMLGKYPVWIITLKDKTGEAAYDRVKLTVRQDKTLILKEEDYTASGQHRRTIVYPKYAEVAPGKFFPSQMLISDEINKGEKSQVTMSELSTAKLPDKVFTKAFLEQVN
jgi:outer membrane lipoprotein-sorting protein